MFGISSPLRVQIVTLNTNKCFILRKQCKRTGRSGKCEIILNSSFSQGRIVWYSFGKKMYYVIELFKHFLCSLLICIMLSNIIASFNKLSANVAK